jgi:hypothetical protein
VWERRLRGKGHECISDTPTGCQLRVVPLTDALLHILHEHGRLRGELIYNLVRFGDDVTAGPAFYANIHPRHQYDDASFIVVSDECLSRWVGEPGSPSGHEFRCRRGRPGPNRDGD